MNFVVLESRFGRLFPLQALGDHYAQYYMTITGCVVSFKQRLHGVLLTNQKTLQYRTGWSVSTQVLFQRAQRHALWKQMSDTSSINQTPTKVETKPAQDGVKVPRVHTTLSEAIKGSIGYIVASFNGRELSVSPDPAVHVTLASVNDEIERLAKLNPGVTFVRLAIENSATLGKLVWAK